MKIIYVVKESKITYLRKQGKLSHIFHLEVIDESSYNQLMSRSEYQIKFKIFVFETQKFLI